MAILPDATQIGINAPESRRGMVSSDTTGYARGAEARARGAAEAAASQSRGDTAISQGNLRAAESRERGDQAAARARQESAGIAYEGDVALAKSEQVAASAEASQGQAFAAGLQDLGKAGIGLGRDIGIIAYREDLIEYERARAFAAAGKIKADSDAKADTDWRTLPQRHDERLRGIHESAIGMVKNRRLADKLRIDLTDDYARSNAAVAAVVKQRSDDFDIGELDTRLTAYKEAAARATDPAEKDEYIRLGQLAITATHAKGAISAEMEQRTRRAFVEDYGKSWVMALPAQQRQRLLREGGSFDTALRDRESSDNPSKVNQFGYAGYYQFGAPRLETLGVYKPGAGEDLKGWSKSAINAQGKWSGTFSIPGFPDVQNLQDFLRNPQAQEAVYGLHKQRMDKEIADSGLSQYVGKVVGGVPITQDGLYGMLHLGGVEGARRALASGGSDVVRDANGTTVLDYARMGAKTGGKTGTPLDFVPMTSLDQIARQTDREVASERATLGAVAAQQFERQMIDAAAGVGKLPDRLSIESNPFLQDSERNKLLAMHGRAAGDVAVFQAVLAKFKDPSQGPFNPYDPEQQQAVDRLYMQMGATPQNLQAVVDRTGIMPKTAVASMQADIISNDPKRVAGSLAIASHLLSRNQNIFAAARAGGSNIEDHAIQFRNYVEDRGMTAEEAATRIIRSQSPEYQAQVKAKIKSEDIDARLKKEVVVGDIESAFDPSWGFLRNPSVGFDPAQRQRMFAQYSEIVKENYLENGDMELSKSLAANTLRKTWGVSNVNGSAGWSGGGVVMQYPPERSPAMAGVENASDLIAQSAIADIKTETGQDVDRTKLRLSPIPGVTGQAFKEGKPAPYMLEWTDKNGIVHMLNPGKAWVADPVAMRAGQTARRQAGFEREQAVVDFRKIEDSVRIPGIPGGM